MEFAARHHISIHHDEDPVYYKNLSERLTEILDSLLPRTMIEYVVVHELVHLIEPHHTNAFWDRMEWIVSDWCARK